MSGADNTNVPNRGDLDELRDRIAVLDAENVSLARSLRRSDARFHDIADNSRNVVSIVDAKQTTQLYVSPSYEAFWERSRETLYAAPKSWLDSVHPEDLRRVLKALENPSTFNEDYRIVRKNGESRWVRTRYTPILNEASELVRLVSLTEDIADWKRLETQLIQAQKMDAVGRLAGGIAHDFNNLLTVINGYSAMLMERLDLSDDVRGDLASITRAGERAASLTAPASGIQPEGRSAAEDRRAAGSIVRRGAYAAAADSGERRPGDSGACARRQHQGRPDAVRTGDYEPGD